MFLSLALLIGGADLSGGAQAQVPDSVSYQGTLTDGDGNLVPDGTYQLTFRLYPDSTGGANLWEESQSVEVIDGVYSVILGVNEPLYADTLNYDRPLWLSVEVENEGELSPRTPLTGVPYAFQAHRLDRTALEEGPGIQIQEVERDSLLGGNQPLEDDNVLQISSSSGGDGNTLDQAYDQGGPGAGRTIRATDQPVLINTGAGINAPGQRDLLRLVMPGVPPAGSGDGLEVRLGAAGNTGDGVFVRTAGTGSGVVGLRNPGAIVPRYVGGLVGSTQPGAVGVFGQSPDVYGVYGVDDAPPARVPATGVAGEAVRLRGVGGHSDHVSGVWGHTDETGTYPQGRTEIHAGVKGAATPPDDPGPGADHWGVAGIPANWTAPEPAIIPDADVSVPEGGDIEDKNASGVIGVGANKGTGVMGVSGSGAGEGSSAFGVRGVTSEGAWPPFPLVPGNNKRMVAVFGQAQDFVGVWGETASKIGVVGTSGPRLPFGDLPETETGAYGHVESGHAVHGEAEEGLPAIGVFGETHDSPALVNGVPARVGVKGVSDGGEAGIGTVGLAKQGPDAIGVYGEAGGDGSIGVKGVGETGGFFDGDLRVTGDGQVDADFNIDGTLTKGAGSFKIDHPHAPKKKTLSHSFVESPEMMNVYTGKVQLNEEGEAWVQLPDYFEALNKNYRYQLTAIGAPAPRLYVARRIEENRFKIAGGKPGMTVSWEVTGTRDDPYARKNRIQVEEEKPPEKQGTYRHPEAYGVEQDDARDSERRF